VGRRTALLTAIGATLTTAALSATTFAGGAWGTATPLRADDNCAKPGELLRPVPWPQQTLDVESVWPFSTGQGVTVAVLSSGVDAGAPQLAGHVERGVDFLKGGGRGPGNADCAGIGTQVAGVIAAQTSPTVGFHGLAPGTDIVPVVVSQTDEVNTGNDNSVDLATFAAAIRWAVGQRVDVLALPAVVYRDDDRVRAAIQAALAANIVVVASAGTTGTGDQAGRIPYPAAYAGVLGVGAVGPDGSLGPGSPTGDFVDLVGPGADLVSTQRIRGLVPVEGTGVATGFVAATAALVRGRWPTLTAAQVGQRLEATATPAAGGPDSHQFGFGLPNPYGAVNEQIVSAPAKPAPSFHSAPADPAQQAREAERATSRHRAIGFTIAGLLLVVIIVLAAVAIPRGRRRRWRSVMAAPPAEHPEADVPSPPVALFDDVEANDL
jgi:membrane-anchored mycosin MYCP